MEPIFIETVSRRAHDLGLELNEEQLRLLELHADLVLQNNDKAGLTEIKTPVEMALKHYLDSFTCLPFIPRSGCVADIGSGPGFPGVPIAVLRPELKVTLVESSVKKAEFLRSLSREMGDLFSVETVRAEDFGRGRGREAFDVVVARAVAKLNVLLEFCLPLVRKGGRFIAMKGPSVVDEIALSKHALEELRGAIEQVIDLNLPGSGDQRRIVLIKKSEHTPAKYPRRTGMAAKKPL